MKLIFPARTALRLAPLGWLALAALAATPAHAQRGIHAPVTATQRATAQHTAAAGVPISELAPDAPDEYTVRRGDTLWGISGKFLRSPWRWPELWGMNLQDIRNPHLIYPGQQLVLERDGDRARLRARRGVDGQPGETVRVTPRNRIEMLDANPLPTLQAHLIEPFLSEPLVVNDEQETESAIVVATQEGRVFTGPGDTIFATRILPGVFDWNVYRKAKPLKEPVTGEILGYEAVYLGRARVSSEAGADTPASVITAQSQAKEQLQIPASLVLLSTKQEVGKGDRLLPAGQPELPSYVPHAPAQDMNGRVVSIYNGVAEAGRYNVVSLSLGKREGIEIGHVLSLHRNRGETVYREDNVGTPQRFQLPEQRYGLVFVFRVFDRIAYALVMENNGPVSVADSVRKP